MKLFSKLIFLVAICLFGQLHADWEVTLKDGSKVVLSVKEYKDKKDNLDKEREVFNKSFAKAYKGTKIEEMIIAKQKLNNEKPGLNNPVGLDVFLVVAFEKKRFQE